MNSVFKYLGMVAFAILPILSSAALQSGKIEVGKSKGTVTLIDSKAQRKPLASGDVFQEGSMVETGAYSTVELVFSNGSSILLTPNTLLEVRTFRQVASAGITAPYRKIEKDPSPSVTELEVPRGKIIGEARKLNAVSVFTVKTPAGMVRIRGTIFTVEYRVGPDGVGRIVVDCVRGSVETTVYSSDAGPLTVEPGVQLACDLTSLALINNILSQASPNSKPIGSASSPALQDGVPQPVRIMLYPIPAEDLAFLAAFILENSTLPEEVAATISAMAQAMATRAQIFEGGIDGAPNKAYGQIVTGAQVTGTVTKVDKSGAPIAPSSMNSGGSTTSDGSKKALDESLKKITDNVQRTVEAKQVQVTPTGG